LGFKEQPDLRTERLFLRRLDLHDAPEVFSYASDPEVTRHVLFDTHRSIADSQAFLKAVIGGYGRGAGANWGIVLEEENRLVGSCGLEAAGNLQHARAELGYVLSRPYWGRGLATEAVSAVISFGFRDAALNRIEARCLAGNAASARVLEKSGMTFEGTLRERELVKGVFRDVMMYSTLRREHGG
jgi:[ribosomal protein S5]-alanine N-acetyltransferase